LIDARIIDAAASAQSELERLIQTVPVAEQRARAKQEASDGGFGSRDEYLAAQQDWIDRKQKLEGARHDLKNAQSGIADAEAKLRQSEAQFRTEALDKLAEADQKAASLAQDLAKADERSRLFRLTAPVDGVVQQLAVHAPGAVVSQAQPILMVVPADEGIAIEAMLQNKDAGFVREGQTAKIKVESFPFMRYGTIPGEVMIVSGDTVQNGDGDRAQRRNSGASGGGSANTEQSSESQEPSYAVRIKPLADHIRADGRDVALTPGMAVTAEIKTGRRRVISYVLDPVARYWGEGLRER
jgi:hemolysin D